MITIPAFISWYLIVGIVVLFVSTGYQNFPPPSRLVKQSDGMYKWKDYVPMPEWLWRIVLTIIWLPYIGYLLVDLRNHIRL